MRHDTFVGFFSTLLAKCVPAWRNQLRSFGLDASLVEDDWLIEQCTRPEWESHGVYLLEFWREVLLTGSPSEIVFTDNKCDSDYLTSLKKSRFEKYGPVHKLMEQPSLRHLAELTEAGQILSKTCERMTEEDLQAFTSRQCEAEIRRENGKAIYSRDIHSLYTNLSAVISDRSFLERAFAEYLHGAKFSEHANMDYVEQFGIRYPALRISVSAMEDVLLIVLAQPLEGSKAGSIRLGWRISPVCPGEGENDSIVLNISDLLPFGRYSNFESICDLGLNMVAYRILIGIVMPDLVTILNAE